MISPQDGIGRANYTDLSPGTYKLEVYSAGLDKVWSKQSATLEIEVLATLGYLVGQALVFLGIHRLDYLRCKVED